MLPPLQKQFEQTRDLLRAPVRFKLRYPNIPPAPIICNPRHTCARGRCRQLRDERRTHHLVQRELLFNRRCMRRHKSHKEGKCREEQTGRQRSHPAIRAFFLLL